MTAEKRIAEIDAKLISAQLEWTRNSSGFTSYIPFDLRADLRFVLSQLSKAKSANEKLGVENCQLNTLLFHVENGLSHPDPKMRALIKALLEEKP